MGKATRGRPAAVRPSRSRPGRVLVVVVTAVIVVVFGMTGCGGSAVRIDGVEPSAGRTAADEKACAAFVNYRDAQSLAQRSDNNPDPTVRTKALNDLKSSGAALAQTVPELTQAVTTINTYEHARLFKTTTGTAPTISPYLGSFALDAFERANCP